MASSDDRCRALTLTELATNLQRNPSDKRVEDEFADGLEQFYRSRADDYEYPGLDPSELKGEFFFRVWRGLSGWRGQNDIEHWLSVILKHVYTALINKIIQRQRREEPIDPPVQSGETLTAGSMDRVAAASWNGDLFWIKNAAKKALNLASDQERRVAIMWHGRGMTLKEIAQKLGMTESQVYKVFQRFAKRARTELGNSISIRKGD